MEFIFQLEISQFSFSILLPVDNPADYGIFDFANGNCSDSIYLPILTNGTSNRPYFQICNSTTQLAYGVSSISYTKNVWFHMSLSLTFRLFHCT